MHDPYSISLTELAFEVGQPIFEQGMPITDTDLNRAAFDWRIDWLMEHRSDLKCANADDNGCSLFILGGRMVRVEGFDVGNNGSIPKYSYLDINVPRHCLAANAASRPFAGSQIRLAKQDNTASNTNSELTVTKQLPAKLDVDRLRIEVHSDQKEQLDYDVKWSFDWEPRTIALTFDGYSAKPVHEFESDISWVKVDMFIEVIDPPKTNKPGANGFARKLIRIQDVGEAIQLECTHTRPPDPQFVRPFCRVWNGAGTIADGGTFEIEGETCSITSRASGDFWLFQTVRNGQNITFVRTSGQSVTLGSDLLRDGGWSKPQLLKKFPRLEAVSASENGANALATEIPVTVHPGPTAVEGAGPTTSQDLLSDAGISVLRQYLDTPREVLRRIPARYLKTAVTYAPLMGWLAPALVSEIVDLTFDEFADEFQQVITVPADDWPLFEREAREVLQTAQKFSHMMASNAGMQSLLS